MMKNKTKKHIRMLERMYSGSIHICPSFCDVTWVYLCSYFLEDWGLDPWNTPSKALRLSQIASTCTYLADMLLSYDETSTITNSMRSSHPDPREHYTPWSWLDFARLASRGVWTGVEGPWTTLRVSGCPHKPHSTDPSGLQHATEPEPPTTKPQGYYN